MKKGLTIILTTLLVLLCACGTQPARNDVPDEAFVMPRVDAQEVAIDAPEYVELAADEAADQTLVYSSQIEGKARYQDVSKLENVFAIPAAYGGIGETVTVTPGLFGQVKLCALDFRITYDSSQLKYIGCTADSDELIVNDEERGVIRANYLRAGNASEGFNLCELQFLAVTSEACDAVLGVEIVDMLAYDAQDIVPCKYSVIPGIVHLNAES